MLDLSGSPPASSFHFQAGRSCGSFEPPPVKKEAFGSGSDAKDVSSARPPSPLGPTTFSQSSTALAGAGGNGGSSVTALPSSWNTSSWTANAATCQPMTSAAMTPIPNNNLVRLFTTVSPTHLPTLSLVSVGSCLRADACGTVEPMTYWCGLLNGHALS